MDIFLSGSLSFKSTEHKQWSRDRFIEIDQAERLGVSKEPVRMAISALFHVRLWHKADIIQLLQFSRVAHRAFGAARFDGVRRPQRMSANAMMPVGADEYDTAVMAAS